jgi:hypothetical protein
MGKAFPRGRADVSASPFCGAGRPQRPGESESEDEISVTG